MSSHTSNKTFAKTPSVLSFQRGMLVTDGAFFNHKDHRYEDYPLNVIRHGIRGTQNVSLEADTDKSGARDPSNIQQTESAKTDHDADGFVVTFGLRMLDISDCLFACAADKVEETHAVRDSIQHFAERAKTSVGAENVCRRIARNIANGSWLWRNRVAASSIRIEVSCGTDTVAEFDALSIPLRHFNEFSAAEIKLGERLLRGLKGDKNNGLQVRAFVSFGVTGSYEVFPSQAYIEAKPKGFARPLYKVNVNAKPVRAHSKTTPTNTVEAFQVVGQAALRDQKISNRLKTIDTWYPDFDKVKQPIPVEPNGANLELMQFFRPKKSSAFGMFARLNQIDPNSDEGKFCIAMMIRGGVLGEKDKEKEKTDSNTTDTTAAEGSV